MLGGIVRSDGTGHYFFLRDPWTGNALETAGVPPVPPVEEIEAVLMRERRGTRASSLPTSVSSLDVKVSRGPGVKVAAVSSAGLRVSIDVGTRAF